MNSKIYVGNLPHSLRNDGLEQLFAAFGAVASAKVMTDRDTGQSRGFGFVEMASAEQAQAAIGGLNGKSVDNRELVVSEARPKGDHDGGGGSRRY